MEDKNLNNILILLEKINQFHIGDRRVIYLTDEIIDKIEDRINAKMLNSFGYGTQGTVFNLSNGKVFKITYDKGEADASKILIGKKHPNVVNFFDIFKFRIFDKNGKITPIYYYGIVEEKLIYLLNFEKDIINDMFIIFLNYSENRIDYDTAKQKIKGNKLGSDVIEGIKFLKNNGIKYTDFNNKNILKDGKGNYKIIDLGFSRVANQNLDIIENINNII